MVEQMGLPIEESEIHDYTDLGWTVRRDYINDIYRAFWDNDGPPVYPFEVRR